MPALVKVDEMKFKEYITSQYYSKLVQFSEKFSVQLSKQVQKGSFL